VTSIVFIGAVGRSGTTLLERTLSTAGNTIALGEMVHLWDRAVRDNERCGCGVDFDMCPFWIEVGDRAFGGWDRVDLEQLAADRRAVDRNRYIPWLLVPRLAPGSFREAHARLVSVLDHLYTAIDATAQAHHADVGYLVDSSKHPSYLFVLRALPNHDVRLLHIVRDPRGVSHSWARHVARPETGEPMEQLGVLRACARWTSHNLLFQIAGLFGVRRRRLAYERFTADPARLGRVVDELVERPYSPLAIDGSAVTLGLDHTVSGNPMRFSSGVVTIRSDESWRQGMGRGRRIVVTALTTPLRQLYGR
jgi:hypothetical protein